MSEEPGNYQAAAGVGITLIEDLILTVSPATDETASWLWKSAPFTKPLIITRTGDDIVFRVSPEDEKHLYSELQYGTHQLVENQGAVLGPIFLRQDNQHLLFRIRRPVLLSHLLTL